MKQRKRTQNHITIEYEDQSQQESNFHNKKKKNNPKTENIVKSKKRKTLQKIKALPYVNQNTDLTQKNKPKLFVPLPPVPGLVDYDSANLPESYLKSFLNIKPRPPLKPEDFPRSDTDALTFCPYDAEYKWDKKYGTIIGWYANIDKNSTPAYIQLWGFDPHFMMLFPTDFPRECVPTFISQLENGMKEYIHLFMLDTPQKKRTNRDLAEIYQESIDNGRPLVKNYQWKKINPLLDAEQIGTLDVVDIYVEYPKLVKIARTLIENPFGIRSEIQSKNETRTIELEQWCSNFISNHVRYSYLFEADIDFVVRYLVDNNMVPCCWYNIQPGHYEYIDMQNELRSSHCKIEVIAHYSTVIKDPESDKKKPPDWIYIVFDEEWSNTGNLFPSAVHDNLIQIVFKIGSLFKSFDPIWVLFAYQHVPNLEKEFNHVFCYKDQTEMILDILRFIWEIDADVWQHQNGNRFDIPYLLERAQHLGVKDCKKLGRSIHKTVFTKQNKNKGFEKWDIFVPGRINIDLLRRTQDDYPGIEDHSLNGLAAKFKLNESKAELPYDRITVSQRTPAGRKNIAVYCKKDVVITDKLVNEVLKTQLVSIETAKMSGIPITSALNRAQGYKVEGGLMHECNYPSSLSLMDGNQSLTIEFIPTAKVTAKKEHNIKLATGTLKELAQLAKSISSSQIQFGKENYTKGKGYKGATVLRPVKGFYNDVAVLTLDFAGMYPSIIMRRNLCFTTLISREEIKKKKYRYKVHYWSVPKLVLKNGVITEEEDETAPAFLRPHIKEGILPKIERKWKDERSKIRGGPMKKLNEDMEKEKAQIIEIIKTMLDDEKVKQILSSVDPKKEWKSHIEAYIEKHKDHLLNSLEQQYQQLDARQLAIKILMNSLYGITGFKDSRFYCPEIASTVTAEGRNMLFITKHLTVTKFNKANKYPFDSEVIYGDTDSVFVKLTGVTPDPIFASLYGKHMAKTITLEGFRIPQYDTQHFSEPPYDPYIQEVELTFEKVILNFNLIKSKNYEGETYVITEAAPTFNAKGLQMLKRGLCPYIKDTLKKISILICVNNNVEGALEYARERLKALRERLPSIPELVQKQRLSKDLDKYGVTKPYKDKKTGMMKTRKPSEGPCVVLAKMQWEKQKKWAEENGFDPESGVVRPAGAGDVIQYVFYKPLNSSEKKKLKKSECVMDPLQALKEQPEIDYEQYITILEKQLCTILRYPVDKCYPGDTTIFEHQSQKLADFWITNENSQLTPNSYDNNNNQTAVKLKYKNKKEKYEIIDISQEGILSEEQLSLLKKQEKEKEKLLDKKVLRIIYNNKPRPPVKIDKNKQTGKLFGYFKPPQRCAICDDVQLKQNTTWEKNSSICCSCATNKGPQVAKEFDRFVEKTEQNLKTIWEICEKCMNAPKEYTLDCTALSCPNMNTRNVKSKEFELLKKRKERIDNSW